MKNCLALVVSMALNMMAIDNHFAAQSEGLLVVGCTLFIVVICRMLAGEWS